MKTRIHPDAIAIAVDVDGDERMRKIKSWTDILLQESSQLIGYSWLLQSEWNEHMRPEPMTRESEGGEEGISVVIWSCLAGSATFFVFFSWPEHFVKLVCIEHRITDSSYWQRRTHNTCLNADFIPVALISAHIVCVRGLDENILICHALMKLYSIIRKFGFRQHFDAETQCSCSRENWPRLSFSFQCAFQAQHNSTTHLTLQSLNGQRESAAAQAHGF